LSILLIAITRNILWNLHLHTQTPSEISTIILKFLHKFKLKIVNSVNISTDIWKLDIFSYINAGNITTFLSSLSGGFLGIMRAPLKPIYSILPWISRALNRVPMMPRDARLSDSFTYDHSSNSSLVSYNRGYKAFRNVEIYSSKVETCTLHACYWLMVIQGLLTFHQPIAGLQGTGFYLGWIKFLYVEMPYRKPIWLFIASTVHQKPTFVSTKSIFE